MPGAGFVKTRKEPDQTGFPASRTADNGCHRARLCRKTHFRQSRPALLRITDTDGFESDFTECASKFALAVIRLIRLIEDAEKAITGGNTPLDDALHIGYALQRRKQNHHRGHQGHERAGGHAALHGLLAGDDQNHRKRCGGQNLHSGRGRGLGCFNLQMHTEIASGESGIALVLGILHAVNLHFMLRGKRLFGGLRHLPHTVLNATVDAPITLADLRRNEADDGSDDQNGESDLDALHEHDADHDQNGQGIGYGNLDCFAGGL